MGPGKNTLIHTLMPGIAEKLWEEGFCRLHPPGELFLGCGYDAERSLNFEKVLFAGGFESLHR
jgi:hypothetical protein